ncbi:uncharacterized protein LOC122274499 [Carya illinoinensis]|uniref:uncharacterized protein LOC122274499 n=1 Tax=Carya illinoinensis TaxID=32201 RepID=UPI001C728CCB|nr:uncharacterized protein LOC122274499 [Carya illinoinensis]
MESVLGSEEANIVKLVPVSKKGANDKQIWGYTNNGIFSIRSAYHLDMELKNRNKGESSSRNYEIGRWKALWKMEVPAVVKNFIEVETVGHAIWSCEAARDVWAENASPLKKWSCSDENLCEIWDRIIQKLPKMEVEMVAVSMRKIWLRRNKLIFEEQFTGPKSVISQAIEDLEEYREAQKVGEVNRLSVTAGGREVKWKRPGENIVKINWDAAFDQRSLKMGSRCGDKG